MSHSTALQQISKFDNVNDLRNIPEAVKNELHKENLARTYDRIKSGTTYQGLKSEMDEMVKKFSASSNKLEREISQSMTLLDEKTFNTLARLVKSLSKEQFVEAMSTGEIPPIKLTPAELELLSGGKWYHKALAIVASGIMDATVIGAVGCACAIGSAF